MLINFPSWQKCNFCANVPEQRYNRSFGIVEIDANLQVLKKCIL